MQQARCVLECGGEAFVFACVTDLALDHERFGVVEHSPVKESGVDDLLAAEFDAALDDLADEFAFPFIGGAKSAIACFPNFRHEPAVFIVQQDLLVRRASRIDVAVRG